MVRVKVQLGIGDKAEKAVWRYPQQEKYENLKQFIIDTFNEVSSVDPYQIQYMDDEGDMITCSSENDVNDALHYAENEKLKSLKLFVVHDGEKIGNPNDDSDVEEDGDERDDKSQKADNDDNDDIGNSEPNEDEYEQVNAVENDDDDGDGDDDDDVEEEEEREDDDEDEEAEDDSAGDEQQALVNDDNNDDADAVIGDGNAPVEPIASDDDENENQEQEQEQDIDDDDEEASEERDESEAENAQQPNGREINEADAGDENGDVEEEKQEEPQEEKQPAEATPEPSIKQLLEFFYSELKKTPLAATDLVVTICELWPKSAAYPIHLGAMLKMVIEDKQKSDLYAFITAHEQYASLLQTHLNQYSGADIQPHIKQMANLCNTVGTEKFSTLSVNILEALRDAMYGSDFNLDFGPLLQATTPKQAEQPPPPPSKEPAALVLPKEADTKPASKKASKKMKTAPKKKQNENERKKAKPEKPPATEASKSKKAAKKTTPQIAAKKSLTSSSSKKSSTATSGSSSKKRKSRAKAKTKRRVLHSHGAYIACTECDACPMRGARFVCMVRADYNLCEECESKRVEEDTLQYPMIKIYQPRSNWHVKHFKGLQELVAIPGDITQSMATPTPQPQPFYPTPVQPPPSQSQPSGSPKPAAEIEEQEPETDAKSVHSQHSQHSHPQVHKLSEPPMVRGNNNINDPSSMLKNFPFVSGEMQEKYMDAMKQFNERKESPTQKDTSMLLPTDSVSQAHLHVHSNSQSHSFEQQQQQQHQQQQPMYLPIASIMPDISRTATSRSDVGATAPSQASATVQNQSLMDEIDSLLQHGGGQSGAQTAGNTMRGGGPGRSQSAYPSGNANQQAQQAPRMNAGDISSLLDLVSGGDPNRAVHRTQIAMDRPAAAAAANMDGDNNGNNGNDRADNAVVESTTHPGDIVTNASATMVWNMRNIGARPFGDSCKLAFVSGDGLLVSQYNIPNARPNELVQVTMSFNAFSTPGTYETNFRLCNHGRQFGPQLIVRMNVLDPNQPRPMQPPMPPMMSSAMQPMPQVPMSMQSGAAASRTMFPPSQPPPQPTYPAAMPPWASQQQQPPQQPYPPPMQSASAYQSLSQYAPPPPQQPQRYEPPRSAAVPVQQPEPRVEPVISRPKPQPQPQRSPSPEPLRRSSSLTYANRISSAPAFAQREPSFNEPTSLFKPGDDKSKDTKGGGSGGWFGFGKKKEAAKKESTLKCLCGATLIYLDVKQAHKGKKAYCDICSKVCKESIFHCPAGDIPTHPGGFDLCYACGGSQLSTQPNPAPGDMYYGSTDSGLADYGAAAVNQSAVYPALKPSAPPQPSPNRQASAAASSASVSDADMYPSQLKQLLDMGFDREKAKRLLHKHRGNMSPALAELIQ